MTTYALQRDRRQAAPDDFSEQLVELLGLPRGRAAAPTTRSRGSRSRCPAAPEAPRAVAARLLAAERDLGGAARPPLRVRRLHQPRRRRDRDGLPAPLRPRRRGCAAPRTAVATLGARRRDRGGGLAADRLEPDGDGDAAPRAADPGPAGRAGAALPRVRGRAGRRQPPDHGGHAGAGPRRAGDDRAAVRRRRGDRRDDHLRPRAPGGGPTSCWPRRSALERRAAAAPA